MIRFLTAVLMLASLTVRADTQVPHTFEDGEVISATEFNQNFDTLESAIDDIPAGATGAQGPQGEQGPAGPQGEQGPAGPAGVAAGLTCTTDQIIKWNGSAWVCADMPSSNTGGDGAAYGSPVWVDSSGTVLTGRDGSYTVFILNGTFQLPGRIVNGTYANASDYAYYLQSGCQGTAYYYAASDSEFVALPGSPNWQVRSGIAGDITIRSRLKTSSNSCEEQETYTSELYQELLDSGIPAPSWLADGTEAFKGLR